MIVKTYKDLKIWQNAFLVADLVIKLVSTLPSNKAFSVISYQIIRSASSVGANIAEGYGRYGPKEYLRFLQIALGSANETEHWLLLIKANSNDLKNIDFIISKNIESIRMIAATIKTIRKNKK